MNPIDEWWNRHFPAHSVARLLFAWAVTPAITLMVALARAAGAGVFSWPLYASVTTMGIVVVTLGWWLAREGYGPGEDATSSEPRLPGRLDPMITVPGRPQGASENDGADGLPSYEEVAAKLKEAHPPREYHLTWRDLAISAAMLFVGITIANRLVWPEDAFTPFQLGLNLVVAALVLAVVATSFSLFTLLLVAAVMSYPLAHLLHLFFYFLAGDEDFLGFYLTTFAMALTIAIGMWLQIRSLKRSRSWVRIPVWATSLGASLMVLLVAVTAVGGDPGAIGSRPAPAASPSFSPAPVIHPTIGSPSREYAAQRLLAAWREGDREGAGVVAHPAAVGTLFTYQVDGSAHFRGCGLVAGGSVRCALQTGSNLLLLAFETTAEGHHYVRYVEPRPPDFPLDLAAYEALNSPVPTPSSSS